jgi:hypothetical protein
MVSVDGNANVHWIAAGRDSRKPADPVRATDPKFVMKGMEPANLLGEMMFGL